MSWTTEKTTNPAATSAAAAVRCISKCTVKPHLVSEEAQKPVHLTPWDLMGLHFDYYQFGLAFARPQDNMSAILAQLKASLSTALTYFFPLSGRIVTQHIPHLPSHHHVFIDCKDSPGVGFVHSVVNVTVSDVLSDHAVTTLFPYLFPLDPGTLNSQGHTLPLLLVQVTELIDGIFIGISCNHVAADGVSFWHFLNSWSEICRKQKQGEQNECAISHPPITKRWFLDSHDTILSLPNTTTTPQSAIQPKTTQRVFHFTSKSVAEIKAKANAECNNTTDQISSFQAVAAFTWRSTTRAQRLLPDQNTPCVISIDNRSRLEPPLSENYFGNCALAEFVTCTAGELLSNNLGWAASMLREGINNHTYHNSVCPFLEEFTKTPSIQSFGDVEDFVGLCFGNSPKFDVYGNDFGWGSPVAARWYANPLDGQILFAPGRERGSVELWACLLTKTVAALEADQEFMHAISPTTSGMQSKLRSRC